MNKTTFWLIWGTGALPMLLAMVMYLGGHALPQDRVNKGELLQEQHLAEWGLIHHGQPWARDNHWLILITLPTDCVNQCLLWREKINKIHTALGKDAERVRVYAIGNQEYLGSRKLQSLGGAVWLADPLGNVVLRYQFDQPPKVLLGDLKKLLKVSRIG